jgi:hypothetical protein
LKRPVRGFRERAQPTLRLIGKSSGPPRAVLQFQFHE